MEAHRGWRTVALLVLGMTLALPPRADALEGPPVLPVDPNAVSSIELIEDPQRWDGQTITFRGEAIGEAMVRGEIAWLHLNDDGYQFKSIEEGAPLSGYNTGMPVVVPARLADEISVFGDYKHRGDIVEVRGVFNAACPEHGGDMDIHAESLRVVADGRDVPHPVRPWKVALSAGLSLLAFALWRTERRRRERPARDAVTRTRV
ncbi:MAG TPA: hypothetical protein VFH17_04120 [Coriobacteriia bacterium]|nr:hypothetical protein [Coriobacteriia bacterium]